MTGKELLLLLGFYVLFVLLTGSFIWGDATEKAWEFHKKTYFGRWQGKRLYFVITKLIAIGSIVAVTIVVILALVGKLLSL